MRKVAMCINPACLHEFPEREALFVCGDHKGTCGDDEDNNRVAHNDDYLVFKGTSDLPWSARALGVRTLARCPECRRYVFQRACPKCHYGLIGETPNGINKGPFITVVGTPGSGKTKYLYALYHAFADISADTGICLYAENDMTRAWLSEMDKQFREQGSLMPTKWHERQSASPITHDEYGGDSELSRLVSRYGRPCLVYRIADSKNNEQTVYFISPDPEGEIYTHPDKRKLCRRLLSRASAIMFFINPLHIVPVEEINAYLLGDKIGKTPHYSPTNVVDVVISLLREEKSLRNDRIDIPVVVVVTHADCLMPYLEKCGLTNVALWVASGVGYENGYPDDQNKEISKLCRTFLVNHHAGDLVGKLESSFTRTNFLFAAANNEDPRLTTEKTEGFHYLRPLRVIDPVFWIFREIGY